MKMDKCHNLGIVCFKTSSVSIVSCWNALIFLITNTAIAHFFLSSNRLRMDSIFSLYSGTQSNDWQIVMLRKYFLKEETALWYSSLSLRLLCQHPIWEPAHTPATVLLSNFPECDVGKQQKVAQILGLLHPGGRHERGSCWDRLSSCCLQKKAENSRSLYVGK